MRIYEAGRPVQHRKEEVLIMPQKAITYTFHHYCPSDFPYFCNMSTIGSDLHSHADFYEFTLIVSGTYRHTFHGQESSLESGHLLYFEPGQTHALLHDDPDSRHYSFLVEESYFRAYIELHTDNADQIFSTHYGIRKLNASEFAYLAHMFGMIIRSSSLTELPIANHLLCHLLFTCFTSITDGIDNTVQLYALDLLRRFDSYRELNTDVNTFYRDYPVSSTTLIHDFKRLTGYTIVQYRNIKRMEYAAHLLEEENYSITEIANMLNISSLGYFSKQFQKLYRMSPKQYQISQRRKRHERLAKT